MGQNIKPNQDTKLSGEARREISFNRFLHFGPLRVPPVEMTMLENLFVAEGFDWVHIGGPVGRVNTEDYADRPADSKSQYE